MSKGSENQLLESEYDGIQEYDNDLPGWWKAIFYVTIAFGIVYSYYMHVVSGVSSQEQFAKDVAAEKARAAKLEAATPGDSEESLLKLVSDKDALEKGKGVYAARCVACHGPEGQGLVGPNLTDDYWIHGGTLLQIKNTVEVGVPDKGMLAWKSLLPADDIKNVVAYIYSIHGTNPVNPKAPQGDLVSR
jgi:cytochrome c oxidase cbb3-type subunit 3